MKNTTIFSMTIALALGFAGRGLAVDFHVATAQDLQNALTLAAANGMDDNIYLTNGYYIGNFNFNSAEARNLTLQAEPGVASDQVTIDGAGGGRSMSLSSSAAANSITVRGLTFLRNCGSAGNAGLRIGGGANAVILVDGCRFISPTNSSGMGLQLVSGLNATVTGCNVVGVNGGGGTGIVINSVTGNVNVQNCTVTMNSSSGLYISGGSVLTITGNTFNGNSSGNGGGAYCISFSGTVTLTGNIFTSNSVATYSGGALGGGAYCYGTTVTLTGNTFTANSSGNGGSGGGGAYCSGTTTTLTGNTFTGNSGPRGGGALCGGSTTTLTGNTFTGNSANDSGGGACLSGNGTLTLSGNTFKLNAAALNGGGLYADGSTVRLLDNLFIKNSQSSSGSSYKGGGVWIRATALDMINNTLTANTAAGSGGGVAFQVDGVTEILHVYNNIIWGNTAVGTGSRKEFLFNDAHDMYGVWDIAVNNLDVAPLFFDPVNGDYHLRNTSACVNAGTNGAPQLPATDLDGGPRIANGTVDIGCYEFGNTIPHPADVNSDWVITDAEYTAYAAAWKNDQTWNPGPNPIPADYVTRAGYLKANGGAYHNDGSTRPTCWKPGAP